MDRRITDLGVLHGDVLLFGGPYSNAHALRALLARADDMGIAHRICTGDIVAYGADPVACCDLLRDCPVVAGNCERQIAAGAGDCGCGFEADSACDLLSRGWYPHAAAALAGTAHAGWFARLPDAITFRHLGRSYAVIHGGLTDIARFLWPTSPDSGFAEERAAVESVVGPVDAIVAGHCGLAFQRRVAGIDWINAGVIGLPPQDGRAMTRFVVLGDTGPVVHRLAYDHHAARAAMVAAGLTQGYHDALVTGHWPSQDVLPPEMRRGRGAP